MRSGKLDYSGTSSCNKSKNLACMRHDTKTGKGALFCSITLQGDASHFVQR